MDVLLPRAPAHPSRADRQLQIDSSHEAHTITGTNHGNGFLNSGMLDTDPHTPNPSSVRVTFTRPGTYRFECVIHPDMDATVTVTP
jgi:plastocyanin